MAKSPSRPYTGGRVEKLSSSVDLSRLSQLLIDVKVKRKAVLRSKKLGGPLYDQFSDAVTDLYHQLDRMTIEQLEFM